MFIFYIFLAILVGCGFATQAAVTARLSVLLASPINAVLLSVLVSMVILLVAKLFTGGLVIAGLRAIPMWLYVSSGALGLFCFTTLIFLTPKIGISLVVAVMIVAQLTLSVIFDHFGLFGLEVREVNLYKILGVVFLITGVVLCLYFNN